MTASMLLKLGEGGRGRNRFILFFTLIPLKTRSASSLILDQNYINTKNQVIKAERRVLKELGFCVHVKHPHKVSSTCPFPHLVITPNTHFHYGIQLLCVGDILKQQPVFVSFQIIVMYLQVLECEKNQTLVQTAW